MTGSLVPVTLDGEFVRLEPLERSHIPALCAVGLDDDLWRWTQANIRTPQDMEAYVAEAIALREKGSALPFATVDRASGTVVGSTRYGNIELANRKVEIGWTWIGRPWQRSGVNTEAKLLMLTYAFETLGCHRVELKTDVLNERSRRAIERLGAKEEGVLRKHLVTSTGRVRDTVYYSILDSEWPEVAAALQNRLAAHR